jgi:hypothetical protein
LFAAALDAVRGTTWKEHWQYGLSKPTAACRRTQRRRIDVATRLLGLMPAVAIGLRERIADVLSVPLLLLAEVGCRLAATCSYRDRARAVVEVLTALPRSVSLVDRLVEAGHLAGLWAAPARWDEKRHILIRCPFRRSGTRAPPAPD